MSRAVEGMKECTKCHDKKPATTENFYSDRGHADGLQQPCKACAQAWDRVRNTNPTRRADRAVYARAMAQDGYFRRLNVTPERRAYMQDYHTRLDRREARLASMRKTNARPERQEANRSYGRRVWQRSGSGVHKARIQDWREFFDGLTSDAERCIAAHVLMFFAGVDVTARKIVQDNDFDYSYIAQHFDSEAA